MADVDPNVLMQMLAAFQMGSGGDGPGMFDATTREQMKAMGGADIAVMKANEALATSPPSGSTSTAVPPVGGEGPSKWDSFTTAMNTPTGAAGAAALLGNLGAAISAPNTWQSRLGTASAGMGQNVIAADRFSKVMDRLAPVPVAPAAPNAAPGSTANFQSALLTNPPQAKPFRSLDEDLRLR